MPFIRPTPALPILLLLSPRRLWGVDLQVSVLHTHLVGLVRSPRFTWCHTKDIRYVAKTSLLPTVPTNFLELRRGEVRRTSLPRTPVNRGRCREFGAQEE